MASSSSSFSSSSSKLFFVVLAILLLSLSGFRVTDGGQAVPRSDVTKTIPCMELLMRCQYQLGDPHPTEACCGPLKYTINHDPQCLCSISFNEDMLVYMNITFQDILTLPDRCGLGIPDLTVCANFDAPKINFATKVSVDNAGSSTHLVGFRKIVTSAVVMLLVSWIQIFPHVH